MHCTGKRIQMQLRCKIVLMLLYKTTEMSKGMIFSWIFLYFKLELNFMVIKQNLFVTFLIQKENFVRESYRVFLLWRKILRLNQEIHYCSFERNRTFSLRIVSLFNFLLTSLYFFTMLLLLWFIYDHSENNGEYLLVISRNVWKSQCTNLKIRFL